MKLRLQSNALRLRLNQTGVIRFQATGHLEAALPCPGGGSLRWILEASDAVAQPQASYGPAGLLVLVPSVTSRAWAVSSAVGIYSAAGAPGPSIAIEKDFQCLHDPATGARDDADSFPNPAALASSDKP